MYVHFNDLALFSEMEIGNSLSLYDNTVTESNFSEKS